jgi:hypothetical protein
VTPRDLRVERESHRMEWKRFGYLDGRNSIKQLCASVKITFCQNLYGKR